MARRQIATTHVRSSAQGVSASGGSQQCTVLQFVLLFLVFLELSSLTFLISGNLASIERSALRPDAAMCPVDAGWLKIPSVAPNTKQDRLRQSSWARSDRPRKFAVRYIGMMYELVILLVSFLKTI
jgi:hypothetical protein